MTQAEAVFHKIIQEIPDAEEGKVFGAACIKLIHGKTVAILWNDNMLFKLDEQSQREALELNGARVGSHLYAPEKPMKGWIAIPEAHAERWAEFTGKAVAYVRTLQKK